MYDDIFLADCDLSVEEELARQEVVIALQNHKLFGGVVFVFFHCSVAVEVSLHGLAYSVQIEVIWKAGEDGLVLGGFAMFHMDMNIGGSTRSAVGRRCKRVLAPVQI